MSDRDSNGTVAVLFGVPGLIILVLLIFADASHNRRPADTEFVLERVEYVTGGGIGGRVVTIFHATDGRAFTFPMLIDAPKPGTTGMVWLSDYKVKWK